MKQMDTTKAGIKAMLAQAGADRKVLPQSQDAHRLAIFRFFADAMEVKDEAKRKELWKQFDATPGWFGCNASAGAQACEFKTATEKALEDFKV